MERGFRPYLWVYFVLSAGLALFVLVVFLKLYLSSLFRHKSLVPPKKQKVHHQVHTTASVGGEAERREEVQLRQRRRGKDAYKEGADKEQEEEGGGGDSSSWSGSEWAQPEGPEGRVVGPEGTDYHEEEKNVPALPAEETRQLQRQVEAECGELFAQLKDLLAEHRDGMDRDISREQEIEQEIVDCLNAISNLFGRLDKGFGSNRSGHITAMILCCNIIMQRGCLQDLSACQEIYNKHNQSGESSDLKLTSIAQAIIEKVVPSIWSS
eukprot:GHVS01093254.1.p1 GENE.GHVS01093254.1~~GHVS01093254.1.p1  ORF type:complete len:267 (+),score=61.36 GHVS01093254.1:161-961(+)